VGQALIRAQLQPETRGQRCWFHKIANVLVALPKSAHPGAKKALAEIWNAEDKRHALDAVKAFEAGYGAKFPKAVAKITDDLEQLLAFYDYPAEHWVHLRTTNPIESAFATVRNRSKITKGPGSRAAGIAMAYKLIEAAQSRWRAVNALHLVALVRPARSSRTADSSNAPTTPPPPRKPPKNLDAVLMTIARALPGDGDIAWLRRTYVDGRCADMTVADWLHGTCRPARECRCCDNGKSPL